MNPAVEAVLKAWTDPGAFPAYHRDAQQELFRRWPVLAGALEELAAAAKGGKL